MSNNKVAVVLCVHHKPWLVMSTLITLALQDFKEYDLYLLYQRGNGLCPEKKTYEKYFCLSAKYGSNAQLSPFDNRVEDILHNIKFRDLFEIDLENDQSLDSGAWYKFIRSGTWRKYEHSIFIQEGTLFTRDNVISSALGFLKTNNVHFLSAGHEKRKVSKKFLLHCNERENRFGELDAFHDQKIKEVFTFFCRDTDFKNTYDSWREDFSAATQNHVPFYFDSLKDMFIWLGKGIKPWKKLIYVNGSIRYLSEIVERYWSHKGALFHKDNELEWFGCSCQHIFSRDFLERLHSKLEQNNLYEVLEEPFAGTPLEVAWGFFPDWLGFDKWFFDGIHRIRKNFVTYKREDDPIGMCHYLNRYFRGKIHVTPDGDFIKIDWVGRKFAKVDEYLGERFFKGKCYA